MVRVLDGALRHAQCAPVSCRISEIFRVALSRVWSSIDIYILILYKYNSDTQAHTLGLVSYKYHVNTLSKELIAKSMYTSQRSAAMPATQVIRYLYEVAMELGSGPTRELLCWQHGQQTLQGRESRGAGVVAANAEAKALLVKALAACVERVEKRVMAANQYAAEMSATAAACA